MAPCHFTYLNFFFIIVLNVLPCNDKRKLIKVDVTIQNKDPAALCRTDLKVQQNHVVKFPPLLNHVSFSCQFPKAEL